jgi:regulator of nucleoside diphosphate kinase
MSMVLPNVIIPTKDYDRLKRLASAAGRDRHPDASFLLSEIRRAHVIDEPVCAGQIVALNRWVTYRLDRNPSESRTLVHPADYVSSEHHLSVLSQVGAALIGIRVGDRMPYLGNEGSFHVVIALSVDPPLKYGSLAEDAGQVRPNLNDEPFDPGPQAA